MSDPSTPADSIAIAHKDYDVRGGGEIVAEHLARTFDAPLYVAHAQPDNHPNQPSMDIREIAPDSRLHRLMARTGTALRGIAHMIHWRDNAPQYLDDYDTVITSGNEPLWWPSRDHQTIVAYTHSTPRWMYDLHHDVQGFIGRTYNQLQRRLYEGRIKDVDLWVANSDLVARRIRKYWNIPTRQIRVVYPPVQTHAHSPDDAETDDYYLYLGRLAEHKRVMDVVETWQYRDEPLRIAGKGPQRDALEDAAPRNVRFEGYVSEETKRELYAGAKAVIYPAQNEDFGMVPVEALAAGTPVIGVEEGFTQYQIVNGENGYTYDRAGDGLYDAIRQFERNGVSWSEADMATWAGQWFGVERFRAEMQQAVADACSETVIVPPWDDPDHAKQPSSGPTPVQPLSDGGGDT